MVARRWQRGGRGGGSGSAAVAAGLAAEAVFWWKHNFSGSKSAFGNAVAAWWWQQQQRCVGGGSLLLGRGEGGGKGWLHALLAVVAMDSDDNRNGDCLSKKGVEQKKGEKELKDGFVFFMLSYFAIVCWLIFFNAGQLISAIVAVCCCYHRGEKKVSQ